MAFASGAVTAAGLVTLLGFVAYDRFGSPTHTEGIVLGMIAAAVFLVTGVGAAFLLVAIVELRRRDPPDWPDSVE